MTVNFDPANLILYDMDEPIEALRNSCPTFSRYTSRTPSELRSEVNGAKKWLSERAKSIGSPLCGFWRRPTTKATTLRGEAGDERVGDIAKGIAALKAVMEEAGL